MSQASHNTFLNWSFTNFCTSSLSTLDNGYIFPFFGTNPSLRSIVWSQAFLVNILSDSFFSNTIKYLWNYLRTIFSTVLNSIKSSSSSLSSSFSSTILAIAISSSIVGLLKSSLFPFTFYFCHPDFVCLPIFHFFPYSSGHLVICTSPILHVTNFIQLVSPQPVDRFSQTKLHWKAPNEGYLYKSDNKWLRYQAISSCKSFVC